MVQALFMNVSIVTHLRHVAQKTGRVHALDAVLQYLIRSLQALDLSTSASLL